MTTRRAVPLVIPFLHLSGGAWSDTWLCPFNLVFYYDLRLTFRLQMLFRLTVWYYVDLDYSVQGFGVYWFRYVACQWRLSS